MKKKILALLLFLLILLIPFQLKVVAAEKPNHELLVNAKSLEVYEQESNNTPEEADLFEVTDAVYGQVNNTDVDFFAVEINYTGEFILSGHAWNTTINDIENYEGLLFSLFNESGELLAESDYYGPDTDNIDFNIFSLVVSPGTYYIGVENTKADSKDYVFYTDLQLGADRLYGATRYSTAVSISQAGWDSSQYAVLTTGGNFPDALSATPLAKKYDAPLLLTEPNNSKLNTAVKSEFQRLNVKEVFIVGGTGAVSAGAEQELKNLGIKVVRLGGSTRYETAVKVAEKLGHNGEIAVVTGKNFADALSMSAIAASKGMPILLTEHKALPAAVKGYLSKNSISKSYVIGGTAIISENVKKSLPGSVRLFGTDRYATNKVIIDQFSNDIDFSFVFVATGSNYPDAISGSALAARLSAPIVLTANTPTVSTKDIIKINKMEIASITALGGPSIVTNATMDSFIDLGNPYLTRYYMD